MGHSIAYELPTIKPAPCDRCQYFDKCAKEKTACNKFYSYVVGSKKAPLKKVRCTTFFRALQYDGNASGKVNNFVSAVLCARSSSEVGIFYNKKQKLLTHQRKDTPMFKRLKRHRGYTFIGCFGPQCRDRRIFDVIERHLYHEQN